MKTVESTGRRRSVESSSAKTDQPQHERRQSGAQEQQFITVLPSGQRPPNIEKLVRAYLLLV